MSQFHKLFEEVKRVLGWFFIASAIFAPVVRDWAIFIKIMPPLFYKYFMFVMQYNKYFLSIGVVLILWRWIKDWKALLVIAAITFYAVSLVI